MTGRSANMHRPQKHCPVTLYQPCTHALHMITARRSMHRVACATAHSVERRAKRPTCGGKARQAAKVRRHVV